MIPVKNILVLTYWSFSDALIQTYTLPYVKMIVAELPKGSCVYLVTLEKGKLLPQITEKGSGIVHIPLRYVPFGISASFTWFKNIFQLNRVIRKKSIDTIHAFCTTAGMIGYIMSKLTGRTLILDSFEPHAEAMVENGEWKKNSWSYGILFYFEKQQALRAKYIIAAAPGMELYVHEKYQITLPPFFVKPACVDLEQFTLAQRKDPKLIKELSLEKKIVCVYAGKFGGIYLQDEVFAFYKACYELWGDAFVSLVLTSHNETEIEAMAKNAGLPSQIFRVRFVPHTQIQRYMGLGDFAITPVKPVPTKRYCTPVKNGEYWAMGLPIVITRNISIDSQLIQENNIGYVLSQLNPAEYKNAAKKIKELIQDVSLPEKIREIAMRHRNYAIARAIYHQVYAS